MYGFIVLAAYAVLMVIVTICLSQRSHNTESFHVADRKLGLIQSAMSIAATWIWAPALFTSAEKAYTNGLPGLFWFLVPNVLCLLIFVPFGKRMRTQAPEGITLSGYMQQRYHSKGVHVAYLFELSALAVLSTAVQLLAGAKILAVVTGWPFWTLPIVVRPDYTIIDGFHRWTVAGEEPLHTKLGGKVPVVVVRHEDASEDIYGTVTHNRARGTHLLEPMKAIVKRLLDDGKTVQEIGRQLGMRPEEVFRLSDFSRDDFLTMMTKGVKGYSHAELLTKL